MRITEASSTSTDYSIPVVEETHNTVFKSVALAFENISKVVDEVRKTDKSKFKTVFDVIVGPLAGAIGIAYAITRVWVMACGLPS